jgi:transaldolase
MKIFLDSVDLTEIKKLNDYGIIDGITTNPTLMSSVSMDFTEVISKITAIVKGDISIEVASNDYASMIVEGNKILEINDNLVIKLPLTWDGIKACNYFARQNIKVNMTLCFSLNQALLAAKSGATYVSPFVGRLEDIGKDGIGLIADIRTAYNNYGIKTEILSASIRTLKHIEQVALCGADVVTVPAKVLSEMIGHHLTDVGLKKFNEDWARSRKKI